jgi:acyl-CoA thioester hydrolase
VLEIHTQPEEVKRASVTLRQTVVRDGETLIDAQVRVAFVAGGKAQRIPKPLRIAMKADQEAAAPGLSPD